MVTYVAFLAGFVLGLAFASWRLYGPARRGNVVWVEVPQPPEYDPYLHRLLER